MIKTSKYDLAYLNNYESNWQGPILDVEALFLYGLVKMVHPQTIVEFGFHQGHSAFNFLQAIPKDCKVYSIDNLSDLGKWNPRTARQKMKTMAEMFENNFKPIIKNQKNFDPADIDHRLIDIAFIDASHNSMLNMITFKKIYNSLNSSALVIVHDTSVFCGHPEERKFVDLIRNKYPEFDQIHLETEREYRYGFTVIQARKSRAEKRQRNQRNPKERKSS